MKFSRRTAWDLAPNRYTEALEAHKLAGRELLDLTSSNPTTIGLAYHEEELLQSFVRREALTYQPAARGLHSAREAVAAYYADWGNRLSADDFVLTTSTSEAYSFIFRLLCDPGDSILVPAPSYPLFDFLADLNDVKLIPYELVYDHGWQIELESLRAATRNAQVEGGCCRAVLVVHPNNPTGSYVKPAELKDLNGLCAANDMAIISDEVFLDFSLIANPPFSFTTNAEVLTFTLSGISKISALPQMKVAWLATTGPDDLKKVALARLEVIADTYLSMSTPSQLALPTMLAERHSVQPQLMHRVRANLTALDQQLATQNLCHRLDVEGGWYAVLRVPMLGTDEELVISLLDQTGVLLQPGHFFNFPAEGYLVTSLITPTDQFAQGVGQALQFIAARKSE